MPVDRKRFFPDTVQWVRIQSTRKENKTKITCNERYGWMKTVQIVFCNWSRPCHTISYLNQYFRVFNWMQRSADTKSHAQFNQTIRLSVFIVAGRIHFSFAQINYFHGEKSQQKQQKQLVNFSYPLAEQSELRLWLLRPWHILFWSSAANLTFCRRRITHLLVMWTWRNGDSDTMVDVSQSSANSISYRNHFFRCSYLSSCNRITKKQESIAYRLGIVFAQFLSNK